MRTLLHLLLLATFFVSCLKETPLECPYQYNLQLYVIDKNYFNASAVNGSIPEDLPFRQYVSNICYTLHDQKTGNVVVEPKYADISQDTKEYSLILDLIPDGEYVLTVWGNVNKEAETYLRDPGLLHVDKAENTDLYVASTPLKIVTGVALDMKLGMQRVKGKLQVSFKNLPDTVARIVHSVSSVYLEVDNELGYKGETNVEKAFLKGDQSFVLQQTLLAPTVANKKSQLMISLYGNNGLSAITVPSIEIQMKRNELYALEINYDEISNVLEIWVLLNNEWTLIKKLDIN